MFPSLNEPSQLHFNVVYNGKSQTLSGCNIDGFLGEKMSGISALVFCLY